jgi:hypothetical protein
LVVVDVFLPRHIADMSRKCPIRLLALNCFSFVMGLIVMIVMIVMIVIAAFSGLTGSGLYAKERNTSQHRGVWVKRVTTVYAYPDCPIEGW